MVDRQISVGAIIVRLDEEQPKYLLLFRAGDKHHRSAWTLPRGKMKEGEYKKQTAVREIEEETGIHDLKFLPAFREKMSWYFREKNPVTGLINSVFKTAYFYLALTETSEIKLSDENQKGEWLDFETALARVSFVRTKKIMARAREYLIVKKIIAEPTAATPAEAATPADPATSAELK